MLHTVILRFRDAGNDTIAEYKRLIEAADYVWWGWWKKDAEPGRATELAKLRDHSNDATPLTIGLFDRSTGSYFLATLAECRFTDIKAGSPEPNRTPSYYSGAKLPAWFKLTAIDGVSEQRFREEFLDVPVGEETFFPVQRGKGPSLPAAARTAQAVQLSSETLLHLSDIHLGTDFGFPSRSAPGKSPLIGLLERDLANIDIGLIIVSGDITTRADANILLGVGVPLMKALTETLRVTADRVVVVPGNHDVALKNYTFLDYSHEAAFRLFLKEFYGQENDMAALRRFIFPDGRLLEILTVNSVRLREPKEKNFGYVEWPLYDDILQRVEYDPGVFRLAVLHHHLVPAPREEQLDQDYPEAGVSTTLDAGAVIEGLQSHGFRLVLHGHQHVPAISKVSRGRLAKGKTKIEGLDKELLVLAAGSAGASARRLSDSMRENSYNLVKIGRASLEIEARCYNPGSPPRQHFRYVARTRLPRSPRTTGRRAPAHDSVP